MGVGAGRLAMQRQTGSARVLPREPVFGTCPALALTGAAEHDTARTVVGGFVLSALAHQGVLSGESERWVCYCHPVSGPCFFDRCETVLERGLSRSPA